MSDIKYKELRKSHPDTVILYMQGNFYRAFNDDAVIISKLAGYKITKLKDGGLRIGFPANSLNKVVSFCYVNKINVVAYTASQEVEKQKFEDNTYASFLASINKDELEYAESKQTAKTEQTPKNEASVLVENTKQYTHFIQGHGMTLDNAVMDAQNSINEFISFGNEIVTLSLVDNLGPNGIFHVFGIVVYKQKTGV